MRRQTFLSKEFFVNTPVPLTKKAILSLPQFATSIQYVGENKFVGSDKFLYIRPENDLRYYVDVSILPLDDSFTHISLHASYTNGQSFSSDPYLKNSLLNFEAAIQAALNGKQKEFRPLELEPKAPKKILNYITVLLAFLSVSFLSKKI